MFQSELLIYWNRISFSFASCIRKQQKASFIKASPSGGKIPIRLQDGGYGLNKGTHHSDFYTEMRNRGLSNVTRDKSGSQVRSVVTDKPSPQPSPSV